MLKDIDDRGGVREMHDIDYRERFDRKWNDFTVEEREKRGQGRKGVRFI